MSRGNKNKNKNKLLYDLIIIGAGSAGLSASIYASIYKLKHLVIGQLLGGLALEAREIINYPGVGSISGQKLMENFKNQALKLGGQIKTEEVVKVEPNQRGLTSMKEGRSRTSSERFFIVETKSNQRYRARALILALGMKNKKLNIPGEETFLGKGISYCPSCDAIFFKNKVVAVVGGNDSAVDAALLLAEQAKKVYLIYRRGKLRAKPFLVEKLERNKKIEIIYNTNVVEAKGGQVLEQLILTGAGRSRPLKLDGLFVEIGFVSLIDLAVALGVKVNQEKFVIIQPDGSTNVPGIFAAGDLTTGSGGLRQIVTAAAEGAVAARGIYNYLKK